MTDVAAAPQSPAVAVAEKPAEKRSSLTKGAGGKRFSNAFTVPSVRPTMRYMPTYRLEPKYPLNKEICENIMKAVIDTQFEHFHYTAKNAVNICAQVSEEIKVRIKGHNFDRYRYICLVTIGEKCMQGFNSIVNFLWDPERDGYLTYTFDMPNFFATATLYYLYYD